MTRQLAEMVVKTVEEDRKRDAKLSLKPGVRVLMNSTLGEARGRVLEGSGAGELLGGLMVDEDVDDEERILCAKALVNMCR